MEATYTAVKTDKIENLWQRFCETKSDHLKEKLVLHYMSLVKYITDSLFSHLPAHVSREDLMGAGALGLIDAIERFEPDRQVKFETFAYTRIRGAILDELRSYDLIPRSVRLKMRQLQKAIQDLEGQLKRSPTEVEIAKKLGISIESYRDLLKRLSPIRFFSLSTSLNGQGEFEMQKKAQSFGVFQDSPELPTENQELKSAMLKAIQNLPKEERLTIALYYYEEMTMKEIGVVLKVSESRVSQIHTQAIIKLRNAVEKTLNQ
jgi:RNA polymerase sigma factor for flagellar operon FliA